MVLCDINIFISAFNGREDSIDQLNKIGLKDIVLSSMMQNQAPLGRLSRMITQILQ